MSRGIYISGKYAVSESGWATDGERECSANGFVGGYRWLMDECKMPKADFLALMAQRDTDLASRGEA